MASIHGEDQILIWRRSYSTPPPPLDKDDERHPSKDRKYQDFIEQLPDVESLKETVEGVIPSLLHPSIIIGMMVILVLYHQILLSILNIHYFQ